MQWRLAGQAGLGGAGSSCSHTIRVPRGEGCLRRRERGEGRGGGGEGL